ncbi:MAG: D-alanine-D-alanine ligase [Candidatus Tokpelaia sp. JSC085]|nr:MAG: D-alanine-D-alanine ligase [Candidatus Tokpelaia sp. JSC085]
MDRKHVAVLMGGFSSERTVSLSSGWACANSLEKDGYRVSCVDVNHDIASVLTVLKPDIAFNALHGAYGEDGTIQGLLEYLQIPYTHSGVLASALAMDKGRAKVVAASAGVSIAHSRVMKRGEIGPLHPIEPPYVVKPIREGSSFGVVIVGRDQSCPPQFLSSCNWIYGDEVLVESYIAGRELTCAVIGDLVLDVCEIIPDPSFRFYNYDSKYVPGGSKHICPAEISANLYQDIQKMSLMAHQALGCRGISRSDFRYDDKDDGVLVWLETNTQPGMTSTSLVPDIAKVSGHSFGDIVRWMVEDASCLR